MNLLSTKLLLLSWILCALDLGSAVSYGQGTLNTEGPGVNPPFCGCAYTASFVNKKMKDGTKKRYYYYKCTTKSRADAKACCGADLKAGMIDDAVVEFIHDFSQKPKLLKAVVEASAEATREGVNELERDRAKLSKELTKREKDSMTLVVRLADPSMIGITASWKVSSKI